jgi:hypothetical protein
MPSSDSEKEILNVSSDGLALALMDYNVCYLAWKHVITESVMGFANFNIMCIELHM